MKTTVYPQLCCEECNEVIHNHIDCLVCNKKYASTNHYDLLNDEEDFNCEGCGAAYKFSKADCTGILNEMYTILISEK